MKLEGRTAIVTGATGGLGKAVVQRLLAEGATTAAIGRRADFSLPIPSDGKLFYFSADLTDEAATEKVFERIHRELPPTVLLAHLVGGFYGGTPVQETPLAEWRRMMELNATSAFLCCRAALRRMEPGGALIAVAADSALRPKAGIAAYAAAKTALIALMQTIAEEEAARRIRANVIAPSIILTDANRRDMPEADVSRWTTPEEIADAIVFLAGNEAVSGTVLRLPLKGTM
ncbi:MAG: SDR family NAD(P)-dependent oxidoreductase [candidate division KSB1 bacterium]|nr:SDR family NAD(P)-dependent oxidoreductase [candidate division KSB1 bacterium]